MDDPRIKIYSSLLAEANDRLVATTAQLNAVKARAAELEVAAMQAKKAKK